MSKEQICSEDEYIPDIHYDSFYQIPKSLNISFYDYTINSFIGLAIATLNSKEHLYIAAIDSTDFYEVTTKDKEISRKKVESETINFEEMPAPTDAPVAKPGDFEF